MDRGFHSGTLVLMGHDEPTRNFFVRNQLGDDDTWCVNQKKYSSRVVLQMLRRNWPIGADRDALDTLYTSTNPADQDSPEGTVPPKEIMELLENYSIQSATGSHEYEMQWDYHDITHNADTKQTRVASLAFRIICGGDELRQVQADMIIPFESNQLDTSLVCRVQANEVGDVIITAAYIDPGTLKEVPVPVLHPEQVFDEVSDLIEKMIAEKTAT